LRVGGCKSCYPRKALLFGDNVWLNSHKLKGHMMRLHSVDIRVNRFKLVTCLWDVTTCNLIEVYRLLGRKSCFILQGRSVRPELKKSGIDIGKGPERTNRSKEKCEIIYGPWNGHTSRHTTSTFDLQFILKLEVVRASETAVNFH
jgi:hypothetical protein